MSNIEKLAFFRSIRFRYGLALAVFLTVAGYFLWTEHQVHILSFASGFLIIGVSLGIHFLMHSGRGDHAVASKTEHGKDNRNAP